MLMALSSSLAGGDHAVGRVGVDVGRGHRAEVVGVRHAVVGQPGVVDRRPARSAACVVPLATLERAETLAGSA